VREHQADVPERGLRRRRCEEGRHGGPVRRRERPCDRCVRVGGLLQPFSRPPVVDLDQRTPRLRGQPVQRRQERAEFAGHSRGAGRPLRRPQGQQWHAGQCGVGDAARVRILEDGCRDSERRHARHGAEQVQLAAGELRPRGCIGLVGEADDQPAGDPVRDVVRPLAKPLDRMDGVAVEVRGDEPPHLTKARVFGGGHRPLPGSGRHAGEWCEREPGAPAAGSAARSRVRDFGPKGRDRAAVCAGSTPLRTVVSCVTEPKPDPGAAGGTPEPAVKSSYIACPGIAPHTTGGPMLSPEA
jgi:hypothetical protein